MRVSPRPSPPIVASPREDNSAAAAERVRQEMAKVQAMARVQHSTLARVGQELESARATAMLNARSHHRTPPHTALELGCDPALAAPPAAPSLP